MNYATRNIVIGPILKREEGYVYDTWSFAEGVRCGYPYRRIEDAHYARKAAILGSARGVTVCQTLDEFVARSTVFALPMAA